jgi:hypothetical protein
MDEEKTESNNQSWEYNPGDNDASTFDDESSHKAQAEQIKSFKWTGPDSFSRSKKFSWYLILLLITAVVTAIIFLLTKDKITAGVIVVSGLLIAIYGAKKPKMVEYQIDRNGFSVGRHRYEFNKFKSFSVVNEGDNLTALLVPLHRFLPLSYINFVVADQDKIIPPLVNSLPHEPKRLDILDRVFRRIGF